MKKIQNDVILGLTEKLEIFFRPKALKKMQVDLKADKSFVTEIDLFVSNLIKNQLATDSRFKNYAFFKLLI